MTPNLFLNILNGRASHYERSKGWVSAQNYLLMRKLDRERMGRNEDLISLAIFVVIFALVVLALSHKV